MGHYYENLYKNSLDANRFLYDNYDRVYKAAVDFSSLLYNTTLPSVYPDAWSSNLSQLVKSSCYLKNGKFGLWEGLGYCGFHTTDITYHASFGLVNLFPDLQKKQMKMGAEFQRKDGRVHHLFLPGFECVDKGFDRVDMNMQFVLMVLRDYIFLQVTEITCLHFGITLNGQWILLKSLIQTVTDFLITIQNEIPMTPGIFQAHLHIFQFSG